MVATPDYVNNVQGTITQTDNPLGLAIAGQGFFAVSQQNGEMNNLPTFSPQQYYTRAGDFQMDKNGYLVNSAGEFLNGWPVNPQTGVVNQNTLPPIQVTQTVYNPVATSNVTLSANLPATPASGTATPASPISSDIDVYDALGTMHTVTLNWVQNAAGYLVGGDQFAGRHRRGRIAVPPTWTSADHQRQSRAVGDRGQISRPICRSRHHRDLALCRQHSGDAGFHHRLRLRRRRPSRSISAPTARPTA